MIGLSALPTGQRDLWNAGAFRPLVQFGRDTRLAEISDIPFGRELAPDPQSAAVIEFAELPFFMALPFAAPPGLPTDIAAALVEAFMAMCRDNAFIEEAVSVGIDLSPIDGAEVAQLIARTKDMPTNECVFASGAFGGAKTKPEEHDADSGFATQERRSQRRTHSSACP